MRCWGTVTSARQGHGVERCSAREEDYACLSTRNGPSGTAATAVVPRVDRRPRARRRAQDPRRAAPAGGGPPAGRLPAGAGPRAAPLPVAVRRRAGRLRPGAVQIVGGTAAAHVARDHRPVAPTRVRGATAPLGRPPRAQGPSAAGTRVAGPGVLLPGARLTRPGHPGARGAVVRRDLAVAPPARSGASAARVTAEPEASDRAVRRGQVAPRTAGRPGVARPPVEEDDPTRRPGPPRTGPSRCRAGACRHRRSPRTSWRATWTGWLAAG